MHGRKSVSDIGLVKSPFCIVLCSSWGQSGDCRKVHWSPDMSHVLARTSIKCGAHTKTSFLDLSLHIMVWTYRGNASCLIYIGNVFLFLPFCSHALLSQGLVLVKVVVFHPPQFHRAVVKSSRACSVTALKLSVCKQLYKCMLYKHP